MLLTRRQATVGFLSGTAIALLGVERARSQPQADPEVPLEADEPHTEVATETGRYDHVMAPVMINGAGPYDFIIDTGASVSCISLALATRLALTPGPPTRVQTITGARMRPSVTIERLEVGARKRRSVRAPVMPIVGFQVDGVLGVDWLKGQRLTLGFKDQKMEVSRSRSDRAAEGRVIVPASRRMGQLTIIDAEASGQKIRALVDSGTQMTFCNARMRDAIIAAERRTALTDEHPLVGMETLAGEVFHGRQYMLPFLRLGGLHLGNVPVVHAETAVFHLWDLNDGPAILLGMDLLRQFHTVALDYGRSAVSFDISPDAPRVPASAASSARMRIHSMAALNRKNTRA